ncbi:tetratricopeptide repeat protein [Nonomuraea terrae]|uniref:tetratricopeptide repeat protein n=1 Tax=Nonomuraea terrae TaxID=2530383 RepID=UPI00379D3BEB
MASEQLDAAMDHWKAGELDAAAALFRQIAATGDPEASHLLAGLLQESGDLDGAEAAHRSVIQSGDPVFGQRSAMAMGMLFIQAKEWAAAHRVLSIASDGADFEVAALADTALVLVCTQLGDPPGAQAALERARRCHSPSVAELAARLEVPRFPDDPVPARHLYDTAEDEDDLRALLTCGDPEVVSLAALRLHGVYAEQARFAAAREVCEHAVAVGHPDHRAMAYRLLGAVLDELGEHAESAAAYRVAAEDPRPEIRLPALIGLAEVSARLGEDAEAKALLRRVVASGHPAHAVHAWACLARTHAEAGETDAALASVWAVLEEGEHTWAPACVGLLGQLLDRDPDARDEIAELAVLASRHPDRDAAFQGALLLEHDALHPPPDGPVEERALRDIDAGLHRLRAGDVAQARRLLRRAADAGAAVQSPRAMVALAELELGVGDREQADELLTYVAEGDDPVRGFHAAFLLHLLREPHPVLEALLGRRRLGREEGLARLRAVAEHHDAAVSAIGAAVYGHALAAAGSDLPVAVAMLRSAAAGGDPLALSYTAVVCRRVPGEGARLLRRARTSGHPALAHWVACLDGVAVPGTRRPEGGRWSAGEAPATLLAMHLGGLAAGNGDFPEALTWYQRVIDAGGEHAGPAAAHLGALCHRLGDRDGALRFYALALGLTEQEDLVAEAACRLGEIRYERGDLEPARRLLEQAVATGHPVYAHEARALLARIR